MKITSFEEISKDLNISNGKNILCISDHLDDSNMVFDWLSQYYDNVTNIVLDAVDSAAHKNIETLIQESSPVIVAHGAGCLDAALSDCTAILINPALKPSFNLKENQKAPKFLLAMEKTCEEKESYENKYVFTSEEEIPKFTSVTTIPELSEQVLDDVVLPKLIEIIGE